jgi:hypothetical protein
MASRISSWSSRARSRIPAPSTHSFPSAKSWYHKAIGQWLDLKQSICVRNRWIGHQFVFRVGCKAEKVMDGKSLLGRECIQQKTTAMNNSSPACMAAPQASLLGDHLERHRSYTWILLLSFDEVCTVHAAIILVDLVDTIYRDYLLVSVYIYRPIPFFIPLCTALLQYFPKSTCLCVPLMSFYCWERTCSAVKYHSHCCQNELSSY